MNRNKDHIVLSDEHNAKGIELADHGMLDEAVREFRRAIELDPDSAHAHDNLATVLTEKKQYREALSEYLKAIALEPDAPTAHYNLACFLAAHGAEMAIGEYKEALDLDPDYPDAWVNLGLTYVEQGETDQAIASFRKAIEQSPHDAFPRHELAVLLMDEEDFREAIQQLKEVIRLDPAHFEAHLDLGICFAQKGFYAEAEKAYAQARELEPDDLLLAYNSAALFALWDRVDDALGFLDQAIRQDPEKVRGWLRSDPMFESLKDLPRFVELLHGS